jgi:hypothetical protein
LEPAALAGLPAELEPGPKGRASYEDLHPAYDHGDAEVTGTAPAAPAGAEFATIRVIAGHRDGNQIEQTINRAWRVTR